MKKTKLLTSILCLAAATLFSQELKIVCNIEAGTMKFFKGKTEVFDPQIKKGQVLALEVLDFNNYIYEVEITETIEKTANSGEGFFKGFEALDLGKFIGLDEDADGVVDFFDKEPNTQAGRVLGSESIEVQALLEKARRVVGNLERLETKLSKAETSTEDLVLDREIRAMALPEFEKLKFNPNLPVSKIKELGGSIFERALDAPTKTELTYDDILKKFEERKVFSKMRQNLMGDHFSFIQNMDELSDVNTNLLAKASETTKNENVFFEMKSFLGKSVAMQQKYEQLKTQLSTLENEAKNDKLDDLVKLWLERETLKSNSFSKKHTTRAAGDAMLFDIKFKMKDSVQAAGAKREFALPSVRVPVHGGLKINTSLGIVFSQFFQPVEQYFLQDDLIQKEKGDAFLPVVTSFLHFYKQRSGNFSLGGSIGLGIPVGGGSTNLQSLSFFAGPSFMLGGSERVVISAGLMGGRPERLASAYQVGDTFSLSLDALPLRRVYELGYFLGISYNLKG